MIQIRAPTVRTQWLSFVKYDNFSYFVKNILVEQRCPVTPLALRIRAFDSTLSLNDPGSTGTEAAAAPELHVNGSGRPRLTIEKDLQQGGINLNTCTYKFNLFFMH